MERAWILKAVICCVLAAAIFMNLRVLSSICEDQLLPIALMFVFGAIVSGWYLSRCQLDKKKTNLVALGLLSALLAFLILSYNVVHFDRVQPPHIHWLS